MSTPIPSALTPRPCLVVEDTRAPMTPVIQGLRDRWERLTPEPVRMIRFQGRLGSRVDQGVALFFGPEDLSVLDGANSFSALLPRRYPVIPDLVPSGPVLGMLLVRCTLRVATVIGGWPLGPSAVYREVPDLDHELPPVFRDPWAPFTVSRAVIADSCRGVRLL